MEIIIHENKSCINCGNKIKGRTDKKFCNENCRNGYNNRLHADRNNLIRNINNALGRNRRILAEIAGEPEKASNVPLQRLMSRGYHPHFFTHKLKCKKGREFIFCYDYGFHRQQNDRCIIVKHVRGLC